MHMRGIGCTTNPEAATTVFITLFMIVGGRMICLRALGSVVSGYP